MSREILIGIDAGTSVIKAVAFDRNGQQLAVASRANQYQILAGGGAEQNLRQTWQDTLAVLQELTSIIPSLAEHLIAIAVTGQGDGTWLMDKDGVPVGDGLLWLDSRAAAISQTIKQGADYPEQYALTGTGVNTCQQSSQLAWLKQYQPERLQQAHTALHCKDWLYYCLTQQRATDPSEAVFTFGNYRTRQYESTILERFDIAEYAHLLPPIVDGMQHAHPLSAHIAAQIGLKAGTPIVLGYVDVVCTALGGGLFDGVNQVVGCSIIGSTGMHMRFVPNVSEVKLNAQGTGYTMCFPLMGSFAQMQSNMAATLNIDWVLDLARDVLQQAGVVRSRKQLLADLDDQVLATPAAQVLYHPYISSAGERGPIIEPDARASFIGLTSAHGYNSLLRSVFEGLGFAAYDCYEAMGQIPTEIRLTGGASRSRALCQIFAALLNRPIRTLQRAEAGAAGAAMIAAVQTQLYPDLASVAKQWVFPTLEAIQIPDPILAQQYQPYRSIYQQTRLALQPIWQALAAATTQLNHSPQGAAT